MKKLLFSLLFIFSAILGYCDDTLQKVRIDDFSGGMNSYDLADIIQPNQAALSKNTVISRKGQIFKRKGQTVFPDYTGDLSDNAWTGGGIFYPDANTKYILAASGPSIIRSDSAAASWVIVNPDLTSGKDTFFLQANDLLFVLNGIDYTAAYDGSSWDPGASSTASPPIGTTAAWIRNYFFIGGNPTKPDWVYFSNNLAPRTFTQATDVFKVNTGDGQAVLRLEAFKLNELIIYKERSIWDLDITGSTPLTNWTLQPVTKTIGLAASRSVVNIGNDHWFLSSEPFAIRSLVRSSFDKILIDMVSQPIQDIFDGTGTTTINRTQISKSCAVLYDNKYILAIPTGSSTTNNLVVLYDFISKNWYEIDGWYPADWVVFNNNLYYVDALDGRMIQCFSGNIGDVASGPIVTASSEPTVAIPFEYISKNIDFDNRENFKALDSLEVEFEAVGNYTAEIFINLDNRGWQSVGTVNMAATTPTLPADLPIVLTSVNTVRKVFQLQRYGEFKKIKIRVFQNGYNQLCNLHSFTIFARMKPWRRE